jgi:hypothetical protein
MVIAVLSTLMTTIVISWPHYLSNTLRLEYSSAVFGCAAVGEHDGIIGKMGSRCSKRSLRSIKYSIITNFIAS